MRNWEASNSTGAVSEGGSSSLASEETLGVNTGPDPMEFTPTLLGPTTLNLTVLEGSTISGGSVVNYLDLGDDTSQSLATINVSPTVDVEGTTLFVMPQVSVANIGKLILKPNTQYVMKVTNTNVSADALTLGGIFRKLG